MRNSLQQKLLQRYRQVNHGLVTDFLGCFFILLFFFLFPLQLPSTVLLSFLLIPRPLLADPEHVWLTSRDWNCSLDHSFQFSSQKAAMACFFGVFFFFFGPAESMRFLSHSYNNGQIIQSWNGLGSKGPRDHLIPKPCHQTRLLKVKDS